MIAPFVVGAPRSGTTLLRIILDSHPKLSIPPETGFIPKFWLLYKKQDQFDGDGLINHIMEIFLDTRSNAPARADFQFE